MFELRLNFRPGFCPHMLWHAWIHESKNKILPESIRSSLETRHDNTLSSTIPFLFDLKLYLEILKAMVSNLLKVYFSPFKYVFQIKKKPLNLSQSLFLLLNSSLSWCNSLGISKLHLSFNMTDVHFPNRWQCRSYFSLSCLPFFSQFSLSAFTLFRILQVKITFWVTSVLNYF